MVVGNVSNGTAISTKQATLIKSHVAGIDGWQLTGDALENADVNNDGIVDEKDITFYSDYLANKNSDTVYFDPNEITGTFIFSLPTTDANSSDIVNNLPITNNDTSFTLNTTTTVDNDKTTVNVNFTYTYNAKSNDGVFLANKNYEILQWDNIPLSRNWTVG